MGRSADKMIEVETVFDVSAGDEESMLAVDFIAKINDAIAKMPEETRAGAVVKLWCSGDYGTAYLELGRPETADERTGREAEEASRARRYRDEEHNRELMMYERLKAKLGL